MCKVTPSSGNVFADLGLPDAEMLLEVADECIRRGGTTEDFTRAVAERRRIAGGSRGGTSARQRQDEQGEGAASGASLAPLVWAGRDVPFPPLSREREFGAMSDEEVAKVRALCQDYMFLAHYGGRSDEAEKRLVEIEQLLASCAPALVHEIDMLRMRLVQAGTGGQR